MTLRALQCGIRLGDLELLDVGELIDIISESNNDSYEYPAQATQDDYDRAFGGWN